MTSIYPGAIDQDDGCSDEGDPLDLAIARLRAGATPTSDEIYVLTQAVRTAQRGFDEIGRANTVLDQASEAGDDLASLLEDALKREAREEIPAVLGALRAEAQRVERSESDRAVALRILHGDQPDEREALDSVPALTADLLPRMPTLYDEGEPSGSSLADFWDRPQLNSAQGRVHRERVEKAAAHLLDVVERAADRSFTDPRYTRTALDEADRAYALWCACLDER
ncbi:hypothetical protein PV692_08945 [Streptomyces sp. AK04-4c]|uniref:hypothetical protein n=1 Tax=Streptomyces sp. AK04-4c TaxID=3028651 RepID=UPI0029BCE333|nr:hypothetical protein [Streptomyces sp. AK04-4c]MDX3683714.1 hypothetical protein [Streptomyces sp. AK04-4c]